jgi:hypothetical protein
MATATSTEVFRIEMADWLMKCLPGSTMVFGSGGVDGEGKVISPSPAQTELADPAGEFPLQSFTRAGTTSIEVVGRLNQGDLVGVPISEAGVKVGGKLYAIRNFAPKIFEADEYFDVNIEIRF